jgi:hypothetical protein
MGPLPIIAGFDIVDEGGQRLAEQSGEHPIFADQVIYAMVSPVLPGWFRHRFCAILMLIHDRVFSSFLRLTRHFHHFLQSM